MLLNCGYTAKARGNAQTHIHMQIVSTETHAANGALHLEQSLSKD